MTNRPNGILYVGVTSDIARLAREHRERTHTGFMKRCGLTRLVYTERHKDIAAAISREKAIKNWHCAWKTRLIGLENPDWNDHYERLM
jgi:putative endonuclease